jgi:hypothetical protein
VSHTRSDVGRIAAGAVLAVCGVLAGAAAFVATNGVMEAITAAAIVVAVGSVGIRWVRSIG